MSERLSEGVQVKVVGLKNRPEDNGLVGIIVGYDEDKKRYSVQLNVRNGKLKRENLEVVKSSAPPKKSEDSKQSSVSSPKTKDGKDKTDPPKKSKDSKQSSVSSPKTKDGKDRAEDIPQEGSSPKKRSADKEKRSDECHDRSLTTPKKGSVDKERRSDEHHDKSATTRSISRKAKKDGKKNRDRRDRSRSARRSRRRSSEKGKRGKQRGSRSASRRDRRKRSREARDRHRDRSRSRSPKKQRGDRSHETKATSERTDIQPQGSSGSPAGNHAAFHGTSPAQTLGTHPAASTPGVMSVPGIMGVMPPAAMPPVQSVPAVAPQTFHGMQYAQQSLPAPAVGPPTSHGFQYAQQSQPVPAAAPPTFHGLPYAQQSQAVPAAVQSTFHGLAYAQQSTTSIPTPPVAPPVPSPPPANGQTKGKGSGKSGKGKLFQVSKALALILRHKANELGLTVRPDGYCDLNAVLNLSMMRDMQATETLVAEAVNSNDKKRFELSVIDGRTMVRAVQGHSLKAVQDEELLRRLDLSGPLPEKCVHGTYMRFWMSILQKGLLVGGLGEKVQRNHIHFAPFDPRDKRVISGMRSDCDIAIYVDLRRAMQAGISFYTSKNEVILTQGEAGVLSPKYFEKVVNVRTGEMLLPRPV